MPAGSSRANELQGGGGRGLPFSERMSLSKYRRPFLTLAILALPIFFLFLFFLVPLANSIAVSVDFLNFDFSGYYRLFHTAVYMNVYFRTIQVSVIVTLVCVVFGYTCAYFIASVSGKFRTILIALIVLPFSLSVLVRNYVWMMLLQDTGLVNRWLMQLDLIETPIRLMYNQFGVIVGMSNMLMPYVIFPVLSALLAIPPDLKTASASLGAGRLMTFARVTFPLTLAGLAAGALLTFIVSLGFYITPAMLGGNREMMIASLIAFNVRELLNWSLAFSLSTTLLCSTIVFYFIYRSLMPRATALRAI